MPLEEISFYTLTGEEINLTNLVNQMVDYFQQKIEIGESKITDFNEGSEIRNLLEAFAVGIYAVLEQDNEFAKFPFISLAYAEWLDRIGENPFINLPRITGDYAEGVVEFTLNEVQTSDFVVPAETVVTDSVTDLDFITTSDCVIPVGELVGEVVVECLTMGADGNSNTGNVNIISDVNTDFNIDLLTVNNTEPFYNGADYEDDEDYRERLLNNVRADGFGTIGYYTALCTDIDGVHDVLLVDDPNYTKKVLVNGFDKPFDDSILLDVLTVLTDESNHVLNHSFTVDKVTYYPVNLNLNITTTVSLDEDMIKDYLVAYVDGKEFNLLGNTGLNINQPLTVNDIEAVLSTFEGFVSFTGFTDIECPLNNVIKLNTITINQTVE